MSDEQERDNETIIGSEDTEHTSSASFDAPTVHSEPTAPLDVSDSHRDRDEEGEEEHESKDVEAEVGDDAHGAEEQDEDGLYDANVDELDIDAALAAVSTLSDMLAEREAAEEARLAQIEAEKRWAEERRSRMEHPELYFEMPLPTQVRAGRLTSIIPGLLLIAIGSWLTFVLTTSEMPPGNGVIAAVVLGGLSVALLGQWLADARWARGSFLVGVTLLLGAAIAYILGQPGQPNPVEGWPLLLTAPGAALLFAAFLTRPTDRRPILPGLILLVAGGAGFFITGGLVGIDILLLVASLWPLAVIIVILIVLLPFVVRRQSADRG